MEAKQNISLDDVAQQMRTDHARSLANALKKIDNSEDDTELNATFEFESKKLSAKDALMQKAIKIDPNMDRALDSIKDPNNKPM